MCSQEQTGDFTGSDGSSDDPLGTTKVSSLNL